MKTAEALVECGYADDWQEPITNCIEVLVNHRWTIVDPFADTLESRRQADSLEDWLYKNKYNILGQYNGLAFNDPRTTAQWRLDRIKYCFEQLETSDE